MVRNFAIASLGLMLLLNGCDDNSGGSGGYTSADYSGIIDIPADGPCEFEDLGVMGHVLQSCQIVAGSVTYSFKIVIGTELNPVESICATPDHECEILAAPPGGESGLSPIHVEWDGPNQPPSTFTIIKNPGDLESTYTFTRN